MKITYQDKVRVRPAGAQVNSWYDDDANEVKNVVNENFDLIDGQRITGIVTFDRLITWVASATTPHTTNIILDTTDSVDGSTACVYYSGPVLSRTNFTGGTIRIFSGENTEDVLCLVWIVYNKHANEFHVNIQTEGGGTPPDPGTPTATAPVITVTEIAGPSATAPVITVTE